MLWIASPKALFAQTPQGASCGSSLQVDTYDFGDAPDSYGTTLLSGGAQHNQRGGCWLGVQVDMEPDGQDTPDADGDDRLDIDDEDGVTFISTLHRGAPVGVQVAVGGGDCVLDAWLDYAADGVFDHSDRIFSGEALAVGTHTLTFAVPDDGFSTGWTYARFRLSAEGVPDPPGSTKSGEVEDYKIRIDEGPSDFGDLPDPTYATLFSSDGARHVQSSDLRLGTLVDSEPTGLPDSKAAGDDDDGSDDGDGVFWPSVLRRGGVSPIYVYPSGPADLNAWIDFDRDGVLETSDRIADDLAVAGVAETLWVAVPTTATLGKTFARFRLSSQQGLYPYGYAPDGEVEDYAVGIEDVMYDFGDLDIFPDPPFATLNASNGARHMYIPAVRMGSCIDSDPDAQTADTCNDGLSPHSMTQGFPGSIVITTSSGGYLSGWMDGNLDGTITPPDEVLFLDHPAVAGTNVVNFTTPSEAVDGARLRLRFSTSAGIGFDGPAPNGEVEDHFATVSVRGVDWGDLPDPP